jgi:hypothetical protein
MLDDLAVVIEAEDVDSGVVLIARPGLVAMEDDVFILRDRALERDSLARILPRHPLEVRDEGRRAIADPRVVLGVGGADIPLDRFARLRLVEHQVVERHRVPLVLGLLRHPNTSQSLGIHPLGKWSSGQPRRRGRSQPMTMPIRRASVPIQATRMLTRQNSRRTSTDS